MQLADLLSTALAVDCHEAWENERTPTPMGVFAVRLHSMGLSVREVVAGLEWLGVDRSHGATWAWTHRLVDDAGYLTALARRQIGGQLDSSDRNSIEKWFRTVAMRIERFHTYWRGSITSARRWVRRFRHHYNHDRPNQALNGRPPRRCSTRQCRRNQLVYL